MNRNDVFFLGGKHNRYYRVAERGKEGYWVIAWKDARGLKGAPTFREYAIQKGTIFDFLSFVDVKNEKRASA